VRLPTAIQRLPAATERSLHSIPGGSGCADTGRVLGIPVRRGSGTHSWLSDASQFGSEVLRKWLPDRCHPKRAE
jgi:hypothetical protein